MSNRPVQLLSIGWLEFRTADVATGRDDDGCWGAPLGAMGWHPRDRRSNCVRGRIAAAEEVNEVVQFTRATRYLLSGLLSFLIIGTALLAVFAGPWMLVLVAFLALLWWRLFALKVVFASDELLLIGLVSVRRVPRTSVRAIEEGSVVVVSKQDRERRITIPIAMSASRVTDNSPDARVKQRIEAAYRRWLAAPATPTSS